MNDAIDTLLRAWHEHGGHSGSLLVIGARAHPDLEALGATLVQRHRAFARELPGDVQPSVAGLGTFEHVMVLPDRQQQRARAEIGRALQHLAPGGTLWCCAPTREGGKRHVKTLKGLLGEVGQDSRARCRVTWGAKPADLDQDRVAEMVAEDAIREVDGWTTRPGLFSWDRPDPGSQALAELLPDRLAGTVADLGAGWGWLSSALVERCPGVTAIHAVEADADAIEAGRVNLATRHPELSVTWHWSDVSAEQAVSGVQAVVMNPPFHVGSRSSTGLGRAFFEQGARMLHPEGELWAVANRQLAYEETLDKAFARHRLVREQGLYKVFHAWAPRRRR